jgi:hypothetical protein
MDAKQDVRTILINKIRIVSDRKAAPELQMQLNMVIWTV